MWLYVPSVSSPASEGSTLDSGTLESLERSVTWRGRLTLRRYWSRAWRTVGWMRRLSGLTSAPSMVARGAEAWISSLADSPARTSAAPGAAPESSTGRAPGCGVSTRGSFARWDPGSSSWRTLGPCLFEALTSFSGTWPAWGSMRNGACSERPTLERRTAESGSSFWPTPTVGDSASAGGRNAPGSNAHPGTSLTDAIRAHALPGPQDGTTPPDGETTSSVIRVLNPRFVEALMGLPDGWTDCEGSGTQSSRMSQLSPGKLSCAG